MSLILKGIDMPIGKDEALLLLILGDGTVAEKISPNRYEEMTDTEAIQIPKGHGRLIDEGQVLFDIVGLDTYKMEIDGAIYTMRKDVDVLPTIRHAPTILESEEE